MSRGLLIGGLVLGGGAALALALREREPLARAAIAVHTASQEAVRKGAIQVVDTVKGLTSGASQTKFDLIAKHNIGAIVDAYRGSISWGLCMAMIEHESEFQPYIYNWYVYPDYADPSKPHKIEGKPKFGKPNRLAVPGAPLVDRWRKRGDGGFEFDPHAVGLLQILDNLRIEGGFKYGGVALPYLNDLIDPEKNIKAALAARNSDAKRLKAAIPGVSGVLLDELIYWSHANGLGTLIGGKGKDGAFSKLKAAGQTITWANLAALPWGTPGWWTLHNKISGVAYVGGRAAYWEKQKGGIVQMGPPEPKVGAAPSSDNAVAHIMQSTVDVLIAEAKEAEDQRNFDTAAGLRTQVDALRAGVAVA